MALALQLSLNDRHSRESGRDVQGSTSTLHQLPVQVPPVQAPPIQVPPIHVPPPQPSLHAPAVIPTSSTAVPSALPQEIHERELDTAYDSAALAR